MSYKHVFQETVYYCGPAVAHMVLAHFGITMTQAEIAQELETNSIVGTSATNLEGLFIRHGLLTKRHRGALWSDLAGALGQGAVIVGYVEPASEEPHYALVREVDAEKIVLIDPWHGDFFGLTRAEFEARWHDDEAEQYGERMLLQVSKIEHTA